MSRYFKEKMPKQNLQLREKSNTQPKKKFRKERHYETDNQPADDDEERGDPFPGEAPVDEAKVKKYSRVDSSHRGGFRSRKGENQFKKLHEVYSLAAERSARAELLLPEEAGYLEADEDEDTCEITQEEIVSQVDITSATKCFDLNLDYGPYHLNYSRDGRYLLIGGKRGHLAAFDWVTKNLMCEINVMESIHSIRWLHMPTMYAVAQKSWVYMYDTVGTELHCIKKLFRVTAMEFLPYHFLLATASEVGFLSWIDISIGKMVSHFQSKHGALRILCQNPNNATLLTGHPNGTVSVWTPNIQEPVLKMLCHTRPVTAVAVDKKGSYIATACIDKYLKIWDVRSLKCLQSYKLGGAADLLDFSQTGLLAVGMKNVLEVYKDCCTQTVEHPYMRQTINGYLRSVQFCPYEDVLGIGHNKGISSVLIPGAGEPNFDAYESNPFMTKTQRREMEVKMLLEKIQPELISLDPVQLGQVDVEGLKANLVEKEKVPYVKVPKIIFEPKKKKRNSAKAIQVKKGVIEEQKKKFIAQAIKRKEAVHTKETQKTPDKPRDVLDRFKPKH